jgi:hypothetical protein
MLLTIYLGISLVCFGLFIFTKLYAVTLLVFGIRYGGKKTLKVLEDGQNNLYNEANDKTKEATDKIEKTLNTIFDKLGWFAFLISCFIPILQIILIFSLITSLLNKGNYERITKEDAEIQKKLKMLNIVAKSLHLGEKVLIIIMIKMNFLKSQENN